MYTQCPECSTAFRVTADILKQAAGKVRCGGCGRAFNALEFLSETRPEQKPASVAEDDLPELKPEPLDDEGLPRSISAEQSAALLKTLDELAGSDIRIEDTGVEWRVLDEDEIGEAAGDPIAIDIDVEDQPEIDEILEASPTPVDQFLTDTPHQIDSPEIFAEGEEEATQTRVDELRFDDNTPLPDDFQFDSETSSWSESRKSAPVEPEPVPTVEPQADIDLSEPDEWTDILDEFEDLVGGLAEGEGPGTDEQDADHPDGVRADEETRDATPLDVDSQFALQAEAMGIDITGERAVLDEEDVAEIPDEEEVAELPDEDEVAEISDEDDVAEISDEDDVAEIPDEDEVAELPDEDEVAELPDEDEVAEISDEEEVAETSDAEDEFDILLKEADAEDPYTHDLLGDEIVEVIDEEDDEAVDEAEQDDVAEESGQLDLIDEAEQDGESDEPEEQAVDEHYVPPMTEEEQTINMQIDQDLLAIAVEDKDGLASAIVLTQDAASDQEDDGEAAHDEETENPFDMADTGTGFETIIMEGDFVRSKVDSEKIAADIAAAADLAGAAAAEREAEQAASERGTNYGMVAGVIVLLLLLLGQLVHQSRNTLATIPAFNDTVGPLYRAIGQPLSPDWDITGWRFEATQGQADAENENLTIYSRIGNNSDRPLPYPLVSVSLTDRFEDVIGNRVLEPADYLTNDLDPRKLVQPGDTFNAAITIHSPGVDAVSFRLRACYRSAGGQLRCKEDGFK
jgi:predicted Zn finger-like uncharacterized protein